MDNNLKIKIAVDNVCIELEGEGTLVDAILAKLLDEGIEKIKNKTVTVLQGDINMFNKPEKEDVDAPTSECMTTTTEIDSEYPLLKDVVIKDLPKTETEWILLYAFYSSGFGKDCFSKNDIKEGYNNTNRTTSTRNKNFATNLKNTISNGWIKSVNEVDFVITLSGISTAKEILNRSVSEKPARRNKQSVSKRSYQFLDLGLSNKEREDFKQFFNSFPSLSNIDKAVVCSYWLSSFPEKTIKEVDSNTVFSALRIADANTSFDIGSALSNGKNSKNYYVSGNAPNKYVLNHIGEDHAKELTKVNNHS